MLAAVEDRMDMLRRQLRDTARRLTGARVLADRLYGVGPLASLAMTCWLGGAGRFSSSRKAVRFAGLDVTVYSSDGKRSPGHLSRQGPEILRWVAYEAGKTHGRASAPGHDCYAAESVRRRTVPSGGRERMQVGEDVVGVVGEQCFISFDDYSRCEPRVGLHELPDECHQAGRRGCLATRVLPAVTANRLPS
jgi:Transposase IS116/IS110/IS902 family